MNDPGKAFRDLPPAERRELLKRLALFLVNSGAEDDLKNFGLGVLSHFASLTESAFVYVEKMTASVDELPQSHQGRDHIGLDLAEFLFSNAVTRERIKDRISKGLVQKPPDPIPPSKQRAVASISGRTFEHEDWSEDGG